MRCKQAHFEDQQPHSHDDLDLETVTHAQVALRTAQAEARRWWLTRQNPLRYSEKHMVGVQDLTPGATLPGESAEITAAQRAKLVALFGEEEVARLEALPPVVPQFTGKAREMELALTLDRDFPEGMVLDITPELVPDDPGTSIDLRTEAPSDVPESPVANERSRARPKQRSQPANCPQLAQTDDERAAGQRRLHAWLNDDDDEDGPFSSERGCGFTR